jgi:competence protein ComEC
MRWISGDGVTLDVLAPSEPFLADTGDDVNENSIVVMLHDGVYREFFMGVARHADVVKVGHHGSRYASTAGFVDAVHPKIAVVSVGRHNTFGHPALATIEAWSATGGFYERTGAAQSPWSMDRRRQCSDARLPERRSSSTLLTYYALRIMFSV